MTPTAAADSLARRGFSRSASSTYRSGYACVALTCEKPHDPLHLGEQQVPRFGFDRLATAFMNNPGLICGLEHVRETIPFPLLLYKIYP